MSGLNHPLLPTTPTTTTSQIHATLPSAGRLEV